MNIKRFIPNISLDAIGDASKSIKLRTLLLTLNLMVLLAIVAFYFLYFDSTSTVGNIVTGFNDYIEPRYKFSIYGAKDVQLVRPMAVFFDDQEQLIYISNTEGHKVDVFKWQGEYMFSFGGFGWEPGKMSFPYGITRAVSGDILVAEAGNRRIQRFSPQGEYLGTILDQPNEYGVEKPGPICSDSRGNLYVADLSGNKVVIIDQQGNLIRTIESVQYPHGIAVDEKNGWLYVANSGINEIKAFSLISGTLLRRIPDANRLDKGSAQAFTPGLIRGVAVDKEGRLLVVDSLAGSVAVFGQDGEYKYSFGAMGNEDWSFLYPNGIDVGVDGRIYIADWANNRISVWGY